MRSKVDSSRTKVDETTYFFPKGSDDIWDPNDRRRNFSELQQ
jgi:hypothetical protein